jgi:hypothetical protein
MPCYRWLPPVNGARAPALDRARAAPALALEALVRCASATSAISHLAARTHFQGLQQIFALSVTVTISGSSGQRLEFTMSQSQLSSLHGGPQTRSASLRSRTILRERICRTGGTERCTSLHHQVPRHHSGCAQVWHERKTSPPEPPRRTGEIPQRREQMSKPATRSMGVIRDAA